jgi:RNase P subunit RPR2
VHAPVSKKSKRCADPLYVLCPITKSPIWTSVATDVRSLAQAWRSKIEVVCPHCGQTHKYRVREAFAETVISNERIRGEFFASWA